MNQFFQNFSTGSLACLCFAFIVYFVLGLCATFRLFSSVFKEKNDDEKMLILPLFIIFPLSMAIMSLLIIKNKIFINNPKNMFIYQKFLDIFTNKDKKRKKDIQKIVKRAIELQQAQNKENEKKQDVDIMFSTLQEMGIEDRFIRQAFGEIELS